MFDFCGRINILAKSNLEEERIDFILQLPGHNPSLRAVKLGTWRQEPWRNTDCWLSLWLVQVHDHPAVVYSPGKVLLLVS